MSKAFVRRSQNSTKSKLSDNLPEIIKRILIGRNIYTDEEINFNLKGLVPPNGLKDIDKAASRLADAVINKERIIIVADYDVDGACAAALALKVLERIRVENTELLIPSRFIDGYGLSEELARKAILPLLPALVLTVDNGIKSHSAVNLIKEAGSDIIITDHHQPDNTLPPADAVVNPKRQDSSFPASNLAGVGVCFYLLCQLRSYLIKHNYFLFQDIEPLNMADFLDLVAIGTIADVVPMDRSNRILTEQGLRRIRRGKTSAGILSLLQHKHKQYLSTEDLSFGIIPRLNAVGRLGDMKLAVQCLLSQSVEEAEALGKHISSINEKRKNIAAKMKKQALALAPKNTGGFCLYDEKWQLGLIGPLAGTLRDLNNHPVIVFAKSKEGMLTGSARSVEGICLYSLMNQIEKENPGLLLKFGGHSRAAGVTICENRMNEFKESFEHLTRCKTTPASNECLTDGELAATDLNSQTARLLASFAPWGKDFPPPVFEGQFQIAGQNLTSSSHLKLRLRYKDLDHLLTAFKFHYDERKYPLNSHHVKIAYSLAIYPHTNNSLYLKIKQIQLL